MGWFVTVDATRNGKPHRFICGPLSSDDAARTKAVSMQAEHAGRIALVFPPGVALPTTPPGQRIPLIGNVVPLAPKEPPLGYPRRHLKAKPEALQARGLPIVGRIDPAPFHAVADVPPAIGGRPRAPSSSLIGAEYLRMQAAGMSASEIAERVGKSKTSVEVGMMNARKRMREEGVQPPAPKPRNDAEEIAARHAEELGDSALVSVSDDLYRRVAGATTRHIERHGIATTMADVLEAAIVRMLDHLEQTDQQNASKSPTPATSQDKARSVSAGYTAPEHRVIDGFTNLHSGDISRIFTDRIVMTGERTSAKRGRRASGDAAKMLEARERGESIKDIATRMHKTPGAVWSALKAERARRSKAAADEKCGNHCDDEAQLDPE